MPDRHSAGEHWWLQESYVEILRADPVGPQDDTKETRSPRLALTFRPSLRSSALIDFALERCDDLGERLGAEVALGTVADGGRAGFGFLGADDQHVGNFLELRVADFRGQLFVA